MNQIWNTIDDLPSVERSDFVDLGNSVYPVSDLVSFVGAGDKTIYSLIYF
jgi:hypothetical protein